MAKNNRVRVTQNKTYVFKLEKLKYIEAESKRLNKTSAQILDEALELHRNLTEGLEILTQAEKQADETERSDVIPESQFSN